MTPTENGDYKYPGDRFTYTCVSDDDNNIIITKVQTVRKTIKGNFSTGINELPQDIRKKKLGKASAYLELLAEKGYIPRFAKPSWFSKKRKVFFEKNSFFRPLTKKLAVIRPVRVLLGCTEWYKNRPGNLIKEFRDPVVKAITAPKSQSILVPAKSTTEKISVQTVLKKVNASTNPIFPSQSAKILLDLASDTKIHEVLDKMQKNVKKCPDDDDTLLTGFINSLGFDTKHGVGALLKANFSIRTVWDITSRCRNNKLAIFDLYYIFYKDPANCSDKGKAICSAQDELFKYLAHFYENDGLNTNKLFYSLATDQALHTYLTDDKVLQQLAKLIASLNIPELDEKNAEESIKLFIKVQAEAIKVADKFNDLSEFIKYLKNNSNIYLNLGMEIIGLLNHFNSLTDVFITTNPLPIEVLLNSLDTPKKIYSIENANHKLSNFGDSFSNFKDTALGVYGPLIMATKTQSIINSKNLESFVFVTKVEKLKDLPVNKTIKTEFSDCAFEKFSFKKALFGDFCFNHVYFKECDFSDVIFVGNIDFKNIHMDNQTATTFLKSLQNSLENQKLKIIGFDVRCAGDHADAINVIKGFQQVSPPQKVEEDIPQTEEVSEQEEEIVQQSQSRLNLFRDTMVNSLRGAAGLTASIGSMAFNAASKTVGVAANTVLHPINTLNEIKEHAQSFYNPKKTTEEDLEQFEKLSPELQNLKKHFEQEMGKVQNQLNQINDQLSAEYQALSNAKKEHEEQLNKINESIQIIDQNRAAKESILQQQIALLEHPRPQIKLYYQTLLSGLCSIFNSIILLNNERLQLLQSGQGKALQHSNKVEKVNGMLSRFGENILEPIDFFSGFIPDLTGLIDKCVKKMDAEKLNSTKHLLRGLTPSKLEKIADEIARKLTSMYQEQIQLLSIDGAIRFSESAVQGISGALLNDQIPDNQNFVNHACGSLRRLENTHNKSIFSLNIPGTSEMLQGKDLNSKYKADDLYRHSIIKYLHEDEWIEVAEPGTNKKFQYCQILEEDLGFFTSVNVKAQPKKSVSKLGSSNSSQVAMILLEKINEQEKEFKRLKLQLNTFEREMQKTHEQFRKALKGEIVPIDEINAPPQKVNVPLPKAPQPMTSIATPTGLNNIGNSCYMNASLQLIFCIPPLMDKIKNYIDVVGETPEEIERAKKQNNLVNCLKTVVLQPDKAGYTQLAKLRDAFCDCVGLIGQDRGRQQDANEFLVKVMEAVNFNSLDIASRLAPCADKKDKRIKRATESALAIQINHETSFQKILNNYFAKEILRIDPEQKVFEEMEKQFCLTNAPEYIVVQLKRYKGKQLANGSFTAVKDDSNITFFENNQFILNSTCQKEPLNYEIIGYLNHIGGTPYTGHYFSYIKNQKDDNWRWFDDKNVNEINPKEVFFKNVEGKQMEFNTEKDAYVLILKKKS